MINKWKQDPTFRAYVPPSFDEKREATDDHLYLDEVSTLFHPCGHLFQSVSCARLSIRGLDSLLSQVRWDKGLWEAGMQGESGRWKGEGKVQGSCVFYFLFLITLVCFGARKDSY